MPDGNCRLEDDMRKHCNAVMWGVKTAKQHRELNCFAKVTKGNTLMLGRKVMPETLPLIPSPWRCTRNCCSGLLMMTVFLLGT